VKRWIAFTLMATAAAFSLAAPMRATGEEERGRVHAEGGCTMGSHFEMTIEPEVGLKFEGGVEAGIEGQVWRVIMRYQNHTLMDVIEETEEDGGFEVVKVENNAKGEDHYTFHALNEESGEFCSGVLEATL
jgi:hypothetical protein